MDIADCGAVAFKDAVEVRGVFAVSLDELRATYEVVLPGLFG